MEAQSPTLTPMQLVVSRLEQNIPASLVKTRDGGGMRLSYLEGWTVIDHLNSIIGHGNWSYASEIQHVHSGSVKDQYGKDRHTTHYIAKVRLLIKWPSGEHSEYADYGYGDGSDKQNPGKAHELAVKEAVTDGLKRCAKNLGKFMGLALYDKTQEFVDDAIPEAITSPVRVPKVAAATPATTPLNPTVQRIAALSRVLVAQEKTSVLTLFNEIKSRYGVEKKEDLTSKQAEEFLAYLESL